MASVAEKVDLWGEVYEGLLAASSPQAVVEMRPSAAFQARAAYLLAKNREGDLSSEEREELHEVQRIDYLLSMLKAQARRPRS
jgi:hypothetical protein